MRRTLATLAVIALLMIFITCSVGLAQTKISVVESAALTRDTSVGRIALAWGGLGTIFGTNLADAPRSAASLPLPVKLGDTEVDKEVDLCYAASSTGTTCIALGLIYADGEQLNLKIPDQPNDLSSEAAVTFVVKRPSGSSSLDASVLLTRGDRPVAAVPRQKFPWIPLLIVAGSPVGYATWNPVGTK